jgi:hypothetical protein
VAWFVGMTHLPHAMFRLSVFLTFGAASSEWEQHAGVLNADVAFGFLRERPLPVELACSYQGVALSTTKDR